MTSAGTHNPTPEPQKTPQHTGRVLAIITGPALSGSRNVSPANQDPGKGWMVMRQRWTVRL